ARTIKERDLAAAHLVRARKAESQALAQMHRARLAELDARTNLTKAEANLGLARKAVDEWFLIARDHPLLQRGGMEQGRKLLLEKALPFYEGFRAQQPGDAPLRHDLADQLFRVGFINAELGRPLEALAAYRRAYKHYTELAKKHPRIRAYRHELAMTCNN